MCKWNRNTAKFKRGDEIYHKELKMIGIFDSYCEDNKVCIWWKMGEPYPIYSEEHNLEFYQFFKKKEVTVKKIYEVSYNKTWCDYYSSIEDAIEYVQRAVNHGENYECFAIYELTEVPLKIETKSVITRK